MAEGLRLVLFGPPGAGKGTQAQLLVDRYALAHVSSGDIFRHNLRQGTPLGLRAREYMDRGELVPDDVVIDIMLDKVMSIHADEGFILDGFPRNTRQAGELDAALNARARNIDRVLHIDVPEGELSHRLGGRYVCRDCQAPYTHHSDAPRARLPAVQRRALPARRRPPGGRSEEDRRLPGRDHAGAGLLPAAPAARGRAGQGLR